MQDQLEKPEEKPKKKPTEQLSRREIEDLMNCHQPTYHKQNGRTRRRR